MSDESNNQLKFFQDLFIAQKMKYRRKCLLNTGILLFCCLLIAIHIEYFSIPFIASNSIWIIGISWVFIFLTCVMFIQFIYDLKPTRFLVHLTIIVCIFIVALIIFPKFEMIELSVFLPWVIICASLLHISTDKKSYKNIEKYCSNRSNRSNENHTAIILARNSEIFTDSFDDTAIDLAKGLTLLDQAYQFYLCTSNEMLTDILLNNNTTRIWIFGHGTIEGVGITEGDYLLYSRFMLEKKQDEMILRSFPKKEAVYQCHCNGGSGWSLADFLLPRKGVLDEGTDDFPNFRETGMNGSVVNFKIFGWKPFGFLQNLNTNKSNREFINEYLTHIERVTKNQS
ncbi:MAG: hypothetical protein Q7J08_04775 [Methanocorpusculum sp.]|uniref:hypothetical protein n=1 Tax=Methanocorpusculum sp. TaxID=2058474 RepID=UPI0027167BE3|nr:hypothetical protein [Methanocorpusculum sp.]MDO9523010.1 hypothetical protein [Methanocorpusculum sp.]